MLDASAFAEATTDKRCWMVEMSGVILFDRRGGYLLE
jgi:hypothetical protein